jgi:Laminin B (Domain IV)/PEP-CTERM motif
MRHIIPVLGICGLLASVGQAAVLAESNWDNPADGVDGWSSANGGLVSRENAGGNPGGYLQVNAQGNFVYWVAPAKFLGNQSGAYSGLLNFDLQQSFNFPAANDDIILISAGLTLAFNTPTDPAFTPLWTSYSVPLLASAGWRIGSISGPAASEAQLQVVLAGLTGLRIRAEYGATFVNTDGIDNVQLIGTVSPVPEPSTIGLAMLGLCSAVWRAKLRMSCN